MEQTVDGWRLHLSQLAWTICFVPSYPVHWLILIWSHNDVANNWTGQQLQAFRSSGSGRSVRKATEEIYLVIDTFKELFFPFYKPSEISPCILMTLIPLRLLYPFLSFFLTRWDTKGLSADILAEDWTLHRFIFPSFAPFHVAFSLSFYPFLLLKCSQHSHVVFQYALLLIVRFTSHQSC